MEGKLSKTSKESKKLVKRSIIELFLQGNWMVTDLRIFSQMKLTSFSRLTLKSCYKKSLSSWLQLTKEKNRKVATIRRMSKDWWKLLTVSCIKKAISVHVMDLTHFIDDNDPFSKRSLTFKRDGWPIKFLMTDTEGLPKDDVSTNYPSFLQRIQKKLHAGSKHL